MHASFCAPCTKPTGPQQWARCDPAKPQRQEPPEKPAPGFSPSRFPAAGTPQGASFGKSHSYPRGMRGRKKYVWCGKNRRLPGRRNILRWPAGAGDRDGTGPCLSPQRRPTQAPGVQAGNPKGHRQEKASQNPPHMPLPHFPFVPCSSIAAAGEKSPQNLSRRWGLFHRAAAHDVHDSRTSLRAELSHLPKNSKPAGVTCRPAGKEGRWFYCGACVRERPSAGHRRGHARTGAQLPWILYQKLSKKARGKSKINLEKWNSLSGPKCRVNNGR